MVVAPPAKALRPRIDNSETKTGYPLEDTPHSVIGGVDDRCQQVRTGP